MKKTNRHLEKFLKVEEKPAEETPSVSESHEKSGDSWVITIPKTRIKSLDELLQHCAVDLVEWHVEKFVVNKWEVGAVPRALRENIPEAKWHRSSSDMKVEPLFQVKAWLVRKKGVIAVRTEVEDLKRLAKESARVFPALKYPTSDDNMLEISIPDLHFGKLAWGAETGWENYDAKIAEDCFHKALGALLDRTKQHTYKKICFVVGNDLLHSDNPKGTTTAGTQVSCDGRFQKTFRTVRTLMTDAIERLSAIAPVNVVMVPGNHDTLAVWHLGDSLECYFNNSPNVAIDNQPRMRKYLRFGRVMLMFTHGDKGKREDYPLVMATEEPEMFGATFWREAHTGHRHQVRTSENHGVRVRILPALCAVDDWHSENQFVGNIRSAEAYIWNGSEGLIGTASYALPVTSTNRVKGQTK